MHPTVLKQGNVGVLSKAEHRPEAGGNTKTEEKCYAVIPRTQVPSWLPSSWELKVIWEER